MFKYVLIVIMALSVLTVYGQKKITRKDLKDKKTKLSYSLGLNIGKQIKSQEEDLNVDLLLAGIKDAMLKDSNYLLTNNEIQAVFEEYQKELMDKMNKEKEGKGKINKIESERFLAENKTKEGVITTPSGLQYKVIREGNGPHPADTNRVKVHYVGKLIDGREFDSSIRRNEPAVFPVKGLIKGWQEALPMMKVGDKWELYIPPELGYGENGAGETIGPNVVLIFELELLGIEN